MDKEANLVNVADLNEEQARKLLEDLRWPHGPECPTCGSRDVVRIEGESVRPGLLRCKACPDRRQFTVTVGTIFEDSRIPLKKWVMAFHLMCSSKKGISALQLKRNLGVAYQTAWFMAHRIRYAMSQEPLRGLLRGTVEVDETYVGGKAHGKRGRGAAKKTPVVALVSRSGKMRTKIVERVTAKELKGAIREHVRKDSRIMTDEFLSYRGIGKEFKGGHKTVNHGAGEYVRGDAYTNNAESYFALLKRGVHGTFHHVSRKHLGRYCDEFAFRWNHRKTTDGERTIAALRQAPGKRLVYQEGIAAG